MPSLRWRLRCFLEALGWSRPSLRDEVKEIEARPLSERELGWVREILACNPDWRSADCGGTHVVAEGPNCEGYSIYLGAPRPENLPSESTHDMVGQLWIEAQDRLTINIQLSQDRGYLREIYILVIDRNASNLLPPESWEEVSRTAMVG